MKIPGKLIKLKRKSRHWTQVQLAKDICTQATISLIENQNRCPNWQVLYQLFERLQIPLTTLQNRHHSTVLTRSIKALIDQDDSKAVHLLKAVDYRQFDRNFEKCQYFCCLGWIKYQNDDFINAFRYFSHLLNLTTINTDIFLYRAWANYGLGMANFKLKYRKSALIFIKDAQLSLKTVNVNNQFHFKLDVWLRVQIMKFILSVKRYDELFLFANKTVRFLVNHHSMYQLASVYMLMAKGRYLKKQYSKAVVYLKRTQTIALIYGNLTMLKRIESFQRLIGKEKEEKLVND